MASASASAELDRLRKQCIDGLANEDTIPDKLQQGAQLVVDSMHADDHATAIGALQVLMDMSCSGSGMRVL
eukprot:3506024-Prymnesium_polylepis.1